MESVTFSGKPLVIGSASARLMATDTALSFWGGVKSKTGEIVDRTHPLCGRFLSDVVLAIPGGRGSCTGSAVILELILNGLAPKALIFERNEDIITLGVIVAKEVFQEILPLVVLDPQDFRQLLDYDGRTVHVHGATISTTNLTPDVPDKPPPPTDQWFNTDFELSDADQAILEGKEGEAARIGLQVIISMAKILGAKELMSVSQAHVDGNFYGPGSLAFGEKLRECGGMFKIPTTLNALNVDQMRWRSLGINIEFGEMSDQLTAAFIEMGARPSFTCAPYQLDGGPRMGDRIAWGESNAVVYANSVLGARTLKTPNMLECLIALTGRAPLAGPYLDHNRLASMWVKVSTCPDADDSFWPILGHCVGSVALNRIPVITGLEALHPSSDDLKAFSAAFATSSSASMFHMVNITREAPSLETVFPHETDPIEIGKQDLRTCWNIFNPSQQLRRVDLIALGNPHFSIREIRTLAELCRNRTKHHDVAVIVTCNRSQHDLATQAGYVNELQAFGVQFLTDTCWCFIESPVIPVTAQTAMTNSGKYIHYGPGLTDLRFYFGSLQMCVEAACSGECRGAAPSWLSAD